MRRAVWFSFLYSLEVGVAARAAWRRKIQITSSRRLVAGAAGGHGRVGTLRRLASSYGGGGRGVGVWLASALLARLLAHGTAAALAAARHEGPSVRSYLAHALRRVPAAVATRAQVRPPHLVRAHLCF